MRKSILVALSIIVIFLVFASCTSSVRSTVKPTKKEKKSESVKVTTLSQNTLKTSKNSSYISTNKKSEGIKNIFSFFSNKKVKKSNQTSSEYAFPGNDRRFSLVALTGFALVILSIGFKLFKG